MNFNIQSNIGDGKLKKICFYILRDNFLKSYPLTTCYNMIISNLHKSIFLTIFLKSPPFLQLESVNLNLPSKNNLKSKLKFVF